LALGNWREVINAKPLEIASFHLCHIFLRLGKLPHLPKQTVGMLSAVCLIENINGVAITK